MANKRPHQDSNESSRAAVRASAASIACNIGLSAVKIAAGVFGRSSALFTDGIHSLADVFSTVIVLIGISIAGRDPDKGHPYGHERFECVAAFLLSVTLFATGIALGFTSARGVITASAAQAASPGVFALLAAMLSIGAKEFMFRFSMRAAQKTESAALLADAWHHRADAMASFGSLAGIIGARMGFPALDPVMGIVICLLIIRVAVRIFIDAVRRITDESCDDETIGMIERAAASQPGVLGVDCLRTRLFGRRIYVEIDVLANPRAPLAEAHAIAQRVRDIIERELPAVKRCHVRANPHEETAHGG